MFQNQNQIYITYKQNEINKLTRDNYKPNTFNTKNSIIKMSNYHVSFDWREKMEIQSKIIQYQIFDI